MHYVSVDVIVEVERHSNQKWEYDRKNDKLFLDRVLKYPYFYPYAYGFIPKTLGNDGDELDVLLISDKKYLNYNESRFAIRCFIVGGLMMYDEKGADEKIFVVPVDEIEFYEKKTKQELDIMRDNIKWFFSNYKSQDEDKWSRVEGFISKDDCNKIYRDSLFEYEYNAECNNTRDSLNA